VAPKGGRVPLPPLEHTSALLTIVAALYPCPLSARPSLWALASQALRGTSDDATMTIPGGAGTLPKASSVLGAPASIIGSELLQSLEAPTFIVLSPGPLQGVTGPVAEVVSQHQGMQHC
jgi:hypothetical protein